jgi:hypothetical protein
MAISVSYWRVSFLKLNLICLPDILSIITIQYLLEGVIHKFSHDGDFMEV